MVTEKDKKFREALLHTLKEYKVDNTLFDELVFGLQKMQKGYMLMKNYKKVNK